MSSRIRAVLASVLFRPMLAMAIAMVASPMGLAHGASPLAFPPPDLDYKATCLPRTVTPPPLDRDWTQWHGEDVDTAPDVMFAIAGEYLRGSDRLQPSRPTAMAILESLDRRGVISRPRIDRLIGKALIATATGSDDYRAGEASLRRAFDAGLVQSAIDLAKLYGPTGPAELRDPAKARQFFRAAAAAGDVDGALAYARILATDPSATPASRDLATSTALLGMIQDVSTGNCHYMPVIADLYLRGELVAADINLAIAWLEQYAETGDARTEERLGNLLVSRFVARADSQRAMTYLESAARQGRPAAALTVGIAYASGTTLQQDPVAAETFLKIAAAGKSTDAEQWLARLYTGEFGGETRRDLAIQHFDIAMAGAPSPELEAMYGQFLAQSERAEDRTRAIAMLRHAATGGIGQAAVLAARLTNAAALAGDARPGESDTWFRLGAALGKPEAARQLARIARCGIGVPASEDAARAWSERALYLGSTTAIYEAARAGLAGTDPAARERGVVLMKQAAYKGMPEALAYLIARVESGRDGFAVDASMAATMQAFIARLPDAAQRQDAELALVEERLGLATSDAERQAQLAALDQLVASGSPAAARLKGDILHDTPGADPQAILTLYATAAQSGDKRALRDYAQALDNNPATAAEARQWVQKAADAGDVKSRIALVALTAPDALSQLDAIAESGAACSADERLALARAYGGVPGEEARPKALAWLQAAETAAGQNADDLFKVASAYRDGIAGADQVGHAEALFQRSADGGKAVALKEIANGYLLGLWADATPERARTALDALLKSGDPNAADMMVRAMVAGQITASLDDIEALLGAAPVTSKTGDTYMKLVEIDESGAFGASHPDRIALWLQKAAEGGSTKAMMRLYRAYAAGIGVSASAETAALWLQKAAEGGDARAADELAAAYDVGFGVPIDPVKAAYWRDRAAAQG